MKAKGRPLPPPKPKWKTVWYYRDETWGQLQAVSPLLSGESGGVHFVGAPHGAGHDAATSPWASGVGVGGGGGGAAAADASKKARLTTLAPATKPGVLYVREQLAATESGAVSATTAMPSKIDANPSFDTLVTASTESHDDYVARKIRMNSYLGDIENNYGEDDAEVEAEEYGHALDVGEVAHGGEPPRGAKARAGAVGCTPATCIMGTWMEGGWCVEMN